MYKCLLEKQDGVWRLNQPCSNLVHTLFFARITRWGPRGSMPPSIVSSWSTLSGLNHLTSHNGCALLFCLASGNCSAQQGSAYCKALPAVVCRCQHGRHKNGELHCSGHSDFLNGLLHICDKLWCKGVIWYWSGWLHAGLFGAFWLDKAEGANIVYKHRSSLWSLRLW